MSKIQISNDRKIVRHKLPARLSHWLLVICFFITGLSGLAFFFPDFSWLTEILGTPQLARFVHPFTGIVMFVAFLNLCRIYWRHNFPEKNDWVWLKNIGEVLKGNEHAVSDNGKYNLGQKMLFWTLILAMITLLVTGIIMWRQYFSHNFSIPGYPYCDLVTFYQCLLVIHWYYGTHLYGILGQRVYSWYGRRLGDGSLGEKTPPSLVS
ncbi:formate dehydrogenase subunit gamma [Pasteurella multocida]